MQTIETKYHGPTNTRGARVKATASGNKTYISLSYDSGLADEDMHATAAKTLCEKLNWHGEMVGGHTRHGMVWVFNEGISPKISL